MIIQAGFDFEILARPLIIQHNMLMPSLVLICLDSDMQLNDIDVVPGDFAGCLVPFQDAVLAALVPDDTKYFAIAHPGSFGASCGYPDPVLDEAHDLESKAAERGMQLIGHFAIDETGYMSARARSYFDQYPRHADLPRTMFHWSHSKHGRCG
ncbi:hypothetical protein ABIB49_002926 [Arthrobacter sp. UYCu512]|uniref:hypothetical protein n=1 Tax=Arthrobacter sp. UYCu512 TaxID=3156338 RepID=UPI0033979262